MSRKFIGQVLPLKKDFTKLLQLGVIGYDQWQVSNNQGKALNFFFKFEDEYRAFARPEGRTITFGGSYTFRIPKEHAPPTGPEAPPAATP